MKRLFLVSVLLGCGSARDAIDPPPGGGAPREAPTARAPHIADATRCCVPNSDACVLPLVGESDCEQRDLVSVHSPTWHRNAAGTWSR